ncbi:MAG: heat-inducible transcriptional repressor HrcA [Gammaproteobacteria bacterium]|nr:heat-inducible transcriptional repressor HrcA [Gammaproteobacteria bacterium]
MDTSFNSRAGQASTAVELPVISERARFLLKTLVGRYILDGQPVSSRALARDAGLDLSPATIRNVMADLEELGLITAPHTSAGRIPTAQGYRLFVDSLLSIQPIGSSEVLRIKSQFDPDKGTHGLLETASSLLSEVTRMASVVMLPRREHAAFRHVEFLSLSDNRVLVILVLNEREVQNRIIHTERQYSPSELKQAANYLNTVFAGQDLPAVRARLLQEMNETREGMNNMMRLAVEAAEQAFGAAPEAGDYLLTGQIHLLQRTDSTDIGKLRQLFDAFTQKRDLLYLLDQCLGARGVQIFIGAESGYNVLQDYSLVTSPYEADGEVIGVLGVIGPTRMGYDRVIPMVDITAKLLGAALNQRS